MIERIPLKTLLIGEAGVWAGLCWYFNGPAVFAYVALHVVTTGVFFALILRRLSTAIEQPTPVAVPVEPAAVSKPAGAASKQRSKKPEPALAAS